MIGLTKKDTSKWFIFILLLLVFLEIRPRAFYILGVPCAAKEALTSHFRCLYFFPSAYKHSPISTAEEMDGRMPLPVPRLPLHLPFCSVWGPGSLLGQEPWDQQTLSSGQRSQPGFLPRFSVFSAFLFGLAQHRAFTDISPRWDSADCITHPHPHLQTKVFWWHWGRSLWLRGDSSLQGNAQEFKAFICLDWCKNQEPKFW